MKVIFIVISVFFALVILHKIRAAKRKKSVIYYCRYNGGFEKMYPEIIQGLKDDIRGGEIIEKNEYSVTISNEYRNHRYFFEQLYGGGLLIRYDKEPFNIGSIHENAIRKLWTFRDDTPANQILMKIKTDLAMATLKNFLTDC